MSSTVLYEQDGRVATITLNRPDRMNTMGDDLPERALETFQRAADDADIWAVILTGAGRAFCAGGDLGAMAEGKTAREKATPSEQGRVEHLRRMMRSSQLLHEMPKITIAAINGACAGAGLSWACACDLRFAAAGAKFNVGFRGAGLSGDFGGTWTLPRIVGPAKARELYLLSPRFDAAEAERVGLVSKVLPDDELMAHVRSVAEDVVSAAPIAVRQMKANLNDGLRLSFTEVLDREAARHIAATRTEDHKEAARAFLEKRKPAFKNR
ncbi:MAG TPA: enoyl-CoA hydratase [Longimicrobiales bacterium]|nr:enoyl-CoA hydratase [Longimicrobiales bacterium]